MTNWSAKERSTSWPAGEERRRQGEDAIDDAKDKLTGKD